MKTLLDGYDAFKDFKQRNSCPYLPEHPDYHLWMAGFELASRGLARPQAWRGLLENQRKGWDANKKHGHGMHNSPTYRTWASMKQRCNNPTSNGWEDYGGRGIKVCDRWNQPDSFINFLSDMGERPEGTSIDRIDVNGNYEPGNCIWSTSKEQAVNKRTPRRKIGPRKKRRPTPRPTKLITYKDKTAPRDDWAKAYGLPSSVLYKRLYSGWDIEKALNTPASGLLNFNNTSGYPGVCATEIENRWTANISKDGRHYSAGRANSPKEAYMLRLHGKKIKYNPSRRRCVY